MKVEVLRCMSEECRKVFAVESSEDYTGTSCPFCMDSYWVTHFAEGEIVFKVSENNE